MPDSLPEVHRLDPLPSNAGQRGLGRLAFSNALPHSCLRLLVILTLSSGTSFPASGQPTDPFQSARPPALAAPRPPPQPLARRLAPTATPPAPLSDAAPAAPATGTQAPLYNGSGLTDPRTGCRLLMANPQPNRSILWSGPCNGGVIAGGGRLQVLEGSRLLFTYDGSVTDGRVTGRGTAVFPDGRRIEGNFFGGIPKGRVAIVLPGVARGETELVNGKMNGFTVLTAPDGSRSEGQFINDVPEGPGTLTAKNGTRVQGTWRGSCFRAGSQVLVAIGKSVRDCPP